MRKMTMIVVLLVLLAGCGQYMKFKQETNGQTSGAMAPVYESMPAPASAPLEATKMEEAPPPMAPPPPATGASRDETAAATRDKITSQQTAIKPKIIRNAHLSIRSEDLDQDLKKIETEVKEAGGYVAGSKADRKEETRKYAHLSIRIPAEKLDDFLLFLQTSFKVDEIATSSQDVTEEYMDLQARIQNAKREEARLLELLQTRTGKLADILEVERELARVREYIESMEGKIRYFDNRVGLSTVEIDLRQEKPIQEVQKSWVSDLWEGIRDTLIGSLRTLGRSLQAVIFFVAAVLPWVVILAVIFYPVWKLVKWRRSRKATPKSTPVVPPPPPSA